MLEASGIVAGYGPMTVLNGVSLSVGEGEVATLLGRNGMGKTTTIRALMGMIRPSAGEVRVGGETLTGAPPHRIARAGLGLVPEGRRVFPTLTVDENLTATSRAGHWTRERVIELFPRLGERRRNLGSQLSGGEQQMLAIGRALMTNPRLLILDEATEGLAPLVREEIWQCLTRLKGEGQSILVVDKNLDALRRIADQHTVIERGEVAWSGSTADLDADPGLVERYLHV